MSQRLPKVRYQVYEDFLDRSWPTPADPDAQTDGAWMAYNYNHVLEVPTSVPAVVSGHPGIVKLSPKAAGDARQALAIRCGQKAKLKDWGRFGCTMYYGAFVNDDATAWTVGLFNAALNVNSSGKWVGVWCYNQAGTDYVSVNPTVYDSVNWVQTAADGADNKIDTDPQLVDWHTVEFEVNYETRSITFYVNGKRRGLIVPPDESIWDVEFCPAFTHYGLAATTIYIDEIAYSTAEWLKTQSDRIQDPENFDLYDDFLYGTTETNKAGQARWTESASNNSSVKSTPSVITGHPGLVKITCLDQTGWGDGYLEGSRQSFKPRDLERMAMTYKPAAVTASQNDSADACSIGAAGAASGDATRNFYITSGYTGATTWKVGYIENNVNTVVTNIPVDLVPIPDGSTWYVVDVSFDYDNQKIKVNINGHDVAEVTIAIAGWWDQDMHLVPLYCYTERATIADMYAIVDELAVKFRSNLSDERPSDESKVLDDPRTTRTTHR